MKTHNELKLEFERQVEELQNICKHEDITDWIETRNWHLGHTGYIKRCKICNKIILRNKD